jgi:hypothetical protein
MINKRNALFFNKEYMDNILEKIITERKIEEAGRLDAIKIVNSLFSELMDRERDILTRRFGLSGDKYETLEKIGSLHKLTRERVRQIEAASIKKIKKLDNLSNYIDDLKVTVHRLLEDHGGLIRRDYLLDILTVLTLELNMDKSEMAGDEKVRRAYRNHFNFLISNLMVDDLEIINKSEKFTPIFKLRNNEVSYLEELADNILEKIDNSQRTFSTEELISLSKQLDIFNKNQDKIVKETINIVPILKSKTFPDKAEIINSNKVLYSLMQAIKNLERNKFGKWGLADWKEIKPKTVNDKIYLILKNEGEPMHFTTIAEKINEVKFDNKKANAATVHNELILDERYILVSRGTYALKEWKNE